MTAARIMCATLCAATLAGLAGCGDGGVQQIKQWMDETRQQMRPRVEKLPEPKKFTPYAYSGKDSVSPYDPAKLAIAFAKLRANSGSGIKPDLDRRREALEAFPLDAVKMVGTIRKAGSAYAVLQVDKAIFHVTVGNYIGQNFGKVTGVSENAVDLKELIQDASGEWVERDAKLELQETEKK